MGEAAVATHVVGRVDVHQQRDQRDDEQHHHRGPVEEHARAELDVTALEPGPLLGDGPDLELLFVLLLPGSGLGLHRHRAFLRLDLLLDGVLGIVDVVEPLDVDDQRQREAGGKGGDTDLGAAAGQALAEEQDEHEGGRRDEGDDPRVFEHRSATSP